MQAACVMSHLRKGDRVLYDVTVHLVTDVYDESVLVAIVTDDIVVHSNQDSENVEISYKGFDVLCETIPVNL